MNLLLKYEKNKLKSLMLSPKITAKINNEKIDCLSFDLEEANLTHRPVMLGKNLWSRNSEPDDFTYSRMIGENVLREAIIAGDRS